MEKTEKARNSQLAREVEIALPVELDREQQIQLVRDYVTENFVSAGMCADIAIHDKEDGNPHAHIMLTMTRKKQRFGEKRGQTSRTVTLRSRTARNALTTVPMNGRGLIRYRLYIWELRLPRWSGGAL